MQHHARVPTHTAQLLSERASLMRSAPSHSESKLWAALRRKQLGTEVRRQVVIGGRFIVDFLAPAERVVIEVDGPYHARRRRADESRDRKLRRLGYHVLRLEAELVERDLGQALALVRAALAKTPP